MLSEKIQLLNFGDFEDDGAIGIENAKMIVNFILQYIVDNTKYSGDKIIISYILYDSSSMRVDLKKAINDCIIAMSELDIDTVIESVAIHTGVLQDKKINICSCAIEVPPVVFIFVCTKKSIFDGEANMQGVFSLN